MTRPRAALLVPMVVAAVAAGAAQTDRVPVSSRSGVDGYTASVRGVVTSADTGAPVPGAEVRLIGSGRQRLTMSDASGRFVFTDLPPERMTLHVSKAGFADAGYGQRHPLAETQPLVLAEGEQLTADVTMSRGGAIYGRVFDEHGEPAAGALVRAFLDRSLQGRSGLQAVGTGDQTDDTGAFRLHGLPPGTFYVSAQPGPAGTVKRGPATYFPGTSTVANALPVDIATGAQVPVSITLDATSLGSVSGVVVNAAGTPSAATITLASDDLVTGQRLEGLFVAGALQISGDAGPDGRFTLTDVPPGSYVLHAILSSPPPQLPDLPEGATEAQQQAIRDEQIAQITRSFQAREAGSLPLTVSGQDVAGVTIVTRPRAMLSGRFVAAPRVSRALPALSVIPVSRQPSQILLSSRGDETIEIAAPTGPFVLTVGQRFGTTLPPGWAVSAIRLNGRDVTDQTIEVSTDATIEVVLTDRVTTVTGTVRADRDGDVSSASVVVFPRDDGRWTYPSSAIRTARVDAGGRFEIAGLPPGRRYLAVAVDYLLAEEEYDARFLERMRRRATDFALDDEGDRRTLRLDLVTR